MEFEKNEWYGTGRVTVRKGSEKITGINTMWLRDGIKEGDVFVLGGQICEIADVTGNTDITLRKSYQGESFENVDYEIIPRAKAVLQAEIALALEEIVLNWNEREAKYKSAFEAIQAKMKVIDALGLYIDSDGDLAQDDSLSGNILGNQQLSFSSQSDVRELMSELF